MPVLGERVGFTTRAPNLMETTKLTHMLDAATYGMLHLMDAYNVRAKVGVLLVEPINGDPYVYDSGANTITFFSSVNPARGAGSIRARIEASMYFDRLVEAKELQEQRNSASRSAPRG